MKPCANCQRPLSYTWNHGNLCPQCRGKRTAEINRAKREKHGPTYFDGKHSDARRNTL